MTTQTGNRFALSLSWIFAFVGYSALSDISTIQLPQNLANGGHWQFLTNLSLLLTLIYFTLNIFFHLFKLTNLKVPILYLSAMASSVEMVVALTYWSLRIFCRDLILPRGVPYISISLDLKIHLLPVVALLTDYFAFIDGWEISIFEGFLVVASLTTAYWFWLEHLVTGSASYPYPFLNVATPTRLVIFVIVSLVALMSFCGLKIVHPYLARSSKTQKLD